MSLTYGVVSYLHRLIPSSLYKSRTSVVFPGHFSIQMWTKSSSLKLGRLASGIRDIKNMGSR